MTFKFSDDVIKKEEQRAINRRKDFATITTEKLLTGITCNETNQAINVSKRTN